MKFSKYVRVVPYTEEEVILYHSITKAVVQVPSEWVQDDCFLAEDQEQAQSVLQEMDYFISDEEVSARLKDEILNPEKLLISLEITLGCNLRCPYCYQADKEHINNLIADDTLDLLVAYFELVYRQSPFKELDLKILGGEPTIVWNKFLYIYEKARAFCAEHHVEFNIMIDTNGVLIEDILRLEGYHEMLLTIPLTHRRYHDKVRVDQKGRGTYDCIVDNMNRIMAEKENATINIRNNVDSDNIALFGDFLDDLKRRLTFSPLVALNYTANLSKDTGFENQLSYADFIRWRSTTAIDELVKREMIVTVSPIVTIEECQFRSRYSMKVFSDGTAGSCAMSFFDSKRQPLEEIVAGMEMGTGSFWREKSNQTLLAEKDCLNCPSLFLCGGSDKLPCIKALGVPLCEPDGVHNVLLPEFLRRYVKYKEAGYESLFAMFQDGLRIR